MATVTQAEYQRAKDAVSQAYTADSLDKYRNAYNNYMSQWLSSDEAYKKASWLLVKNSTTSTPTTTTTTPTKTTTTTTTSNQNTWLNSMSSQVAQNNSRNSQVGTWDVAEMPQQQEIVSPARADRLAKSWNNLTYEQQQERLNRTAWLKDALAQRGITSKTQPTTTTQPTQPTQQRTSTVPTAKQAQWDYQVLPDVKWLINKASLTESRLWLRNW